MKLITQNPEHCHKYRNSTSQKYEIQSRHVFPDILTQKNNIVFRSLSPSSWCPCDGTCPKCTSNNSNNNGIMTSNLKVSKPDDPLEKEADNIAEQIVDVNCDYILEKLSNENMEEKKEGNVEERKEEKMEEKMEENVEKKMEKKKGEKREKKGKKEKKKDNKGKSAKKKLIKYAKKNRIWS